MAKNTKRLEAILANTKENIQLVREELQAGASLQHVYDELNAHDRLLSARLKEIAEWNKKQDQAAAAQKAAEKAAAEKADADKAAAEKAAAEKAAAEKAAAEKAAADKAAAGKATKADAPAPGPENWAKEYANFSKEELLAVQASAVKVLAKEPGRKDAQSVNEVITELLKKFA